MANAGYDLPDPVDPNGEILLEPIDRVPAPEAGDDLMSQLAGDAIERMMSNSAANPVQQLTAQIGAFFEELHERHTIAAVVSSEERRELEQEILNIPEAIPIELPPSLLGPVDQKPSPMMRPFDWCGGMVESLSPGSRFLLSATSVLSFVAGCAALTYVLMLRGT